MSESKVPIDVAIVGAGPAGLCAADILTRSGHRAVVFEARDRVGGRLLSVEAGTETEVAGARLDLGATWFWANEPRVNAVIAAEGLEVFEQHLAGDAMFQNGQGCQRMQGNQIDAPSGRLVRGTQSIAQALAARLDADVVKLSHVVTGVTGADEHLVVASDSGEYRARHLIIAVPPATAVARIDFADLLSDRVAALAAATPVWMGSIVKVVVRYQRAFWRETGLAGAAFSYVGPMRELHDMSGPAGEPAAIFGFAQPGAGGRAPVVAEVVDQMVDLFGPDAAHPVDVLIKDWRAEPFTSPQSVDELTNFQTYGHPLYAEAAGGGRIHWASTETATQAPGHIEGALQAAARAADAVAAALAGGSS